MNSISSERALIVSGLQKKIIDLQTKLAESGNGKEGLVAELDSICNEVLSLADNTLRSECGEREAIDCLIRRGDAYRCKYEHAKQTKSFAADRSEDAYKNAYDLVTHSQSPSLSRFEDTLALTCALKYSLFLSEIRKEPRRAEEILQEVEKKRNEKHCCSVYNLKKDYAELQKVHLKELLRDDRRNNKLFTQYQEIIFDYTHEKITEKTLKEFQDIVEATSLKEKIAGLFNGKLLNATQGRSVLHTTLRAPLSSTLHLSPALKPTLQEVHSVLLNIQKFADSVRSGERRGATGKAFHNLILIGIGGSYLSVQCVYQALRSHPAYKKASDKRTLRFLANVDPVDFSRAVEGLNAEETFILINSKTFTTAETMLNARSCKQWLITELHQKGVNDEKTIINRHFCACSTNLEATARFGINGKNVFGFWDFVGGRFSVWSAVGMLPLSLHFSFDVMSKFLEGAHSIDKLLLQPDLQKNIPMLLGIIGYYHAAVQGYEARAVIPYCQALCRLAPHLQQLDMESNGKRVDIEGRLLNYEAAVVTFGEPGTNGQHSFFQLLHQGRVVPVEFIGFTRSQQPSHLQGEVSSHDELISNFFSQPDALATGLTRDALMMEGVSSSLLPHKEFEGNRPSCSLLFLGELDAYKCGQLLALYEHRTAVEGFLWGVNSFDQYGVELGKALANDVRIVIKEGKIGSGLLAKYLMDRQ